MVNAVILHCPGDEERARWIAGAWRGGRATVLRLGQDRSRAPVGANSVLIGLWSGGSRAEDGGRRLADALGAADARSLLVVWDGRPPLSEAAAAGVPVIVAPEGRGELIDRLQAAAAKLGDAASEDAARPADPRAGMVGLLIGIGLGAAAAIAAILSLAMHWTR
jgi:hypothetical protein